MALQTSGAISLNEIHIEAGGTTGTSASINDSDIRGLIDKASGAQMAFSEWYGADFYINLTYVDKSSVAGSSSVSSISYPSGTSSGDLIIACISDSRSNVGSGLSPVADLTGFTQLDNRINTLSESTKGGTIFYRSRVRIMYKIAGAESSASCDLTSSSGGGIALYSFTPSRSISTVSANSFVKDTSSANDVSLSTTESQPVILIANSWTDDTNGTPSPATDFVDVGNQNSVILYDGDGTATLTVDFDGGSLSGYPRFNHHGYLTWS